jgi:hypothetical protein
MVIYLYIQLVEEGRSKGGQKRATSERQPSWQSTCTHPAKRQPLRVASIERMVERGLVAGYVNFLDKGAK